MVIPTSRFPPLSPNLAQHTRLLSSAGGARMPHLDMCTAHGGKMHVKLRQRHYVGLNHLHYYDGQHLPPQCLTPASCHLRGERVDRGRRLTSLCGTHEGLIHSCQITHHSATFSPRRRLDPCLSRGHMAMQNRHYNANPEGRGQGLHRFPTQRSNARHRRHHRSLSAPPGPSPAHSNHSSAVQPNRIAVDKPVLHDYPR
jgi:hypothetical protein